MGDDRNRPMREAAYVVHGTEFAVGRREMLLVDERGSVDGDGDDVGGTLAGVVVGERHGQPWQSALTVGVCAEATPAMSIKPVEAAHEDGPQPCRPRRPSASRGLGRTCDYSRP